MAHPIIFSGMLEDALQESSLFDLLRVMGALPVTPSNMYKLLYSKSFVLLYPGGVREALYRKVHRFSSYFLNYSVCSL